MEYQVTLPSKPRVVSEEANQGVYEIDSLYPGYGHTLGNSLRRIILSSLSGAAITSVKIDEVPHEFATIEGVRESVMEVLLNLKRVHFVLHGDEPQTVRLSVKGPKTITAADFTMPSQVEIANPDQYIADIAGKIPFELEATIERGLGYVPREMLTKEKVDIGTIALDATFTPIRRVNYEVENMRIGDRTDHNRLRLFIETDGTLTPREALERSISIMISQLKAIVGFVEEEVSASAEEYASGEGHAEKQEIDQDVLKTRIEALDLSTRTSNALAAANIRTLGGLARKKEEDLREIDGMGDKGIGEIRDVLAAHGITLK